MTENTFTGYLYRINHTNPAEIIVAEVSYWQPYANWVSYQIKGCHVVYGMNAADFGKYNSRGIMLKERNDKEYLRIVLEAEENALQIAKSNIKLSEQKIKALSDAINALDVQK